MPKLSKKLAKQVQEAPENEYTPLDPGTYTVILREVRDVDQEGNKLVGKDSGIPYWNWRFELDPEEGHGKRQFFMTTSLGETSAWKMKEVFGAFGYSPDSDTDEMIGEKCKAVVSVRVAEQGKYVGQKVNQLERVFSLEEGEDEDPDDGF